MASLTAPLSRSEFVEETRGLVDFIAQAWCRSFTHRFHYTRLSDLPNGCHDKGKWRCRNLREACQRYGWKGKSLDDQGFVQLQDTLREAMTDPQATDADVHSCLDCIFRWGGVGQNSKVGARPWVGRLVKVGNLKTTLLAMRDALKQDPPKLERFDGNDFRWDSALTKAMAFLDSQFVIYDARVGAALAYLTRCHLKRVNHTAVPEHLAFPWAPSRNPQSRNADPSVGTLRFPRRHSAAGQYSRQLARANVYANWLLAEVISEIDRTAPGKSARWPYSLSVVPALRQLEAALFMIGYCIPR